MCVKQAKYGVHPGVMQSLMSHAWLVSWLRCQASVLHYKMQSNSFASPLGCLSACLVTKLQCFYAGAEACFASTH